MIHQWAVEHPEAPVYMDAREFYAAHNAIRGLGGASELLRTFPSLLEKMSVHTYPEAIDLRDQLLAGLGDLATTLNDVLAQTTVTEEAAEPVIAQTKPSLMAMAESGIYFDPRHRIADL